MERERRELVREEESLKMAVQQMQRDVAQLRESITQLGKSGLEKKNLLEPNNPAQLFCAGYALLSLAGNT